jgi:hypothetical protein
VKQGKDMISSTTSLNPFSLMMEPELVLQAMERSNSLRSLRRHHMRPLDKPLIPYKSLPGEEALELDDDDFDFDL